MRCSDRGADSVRERLTRRSERVSVVCNSGVRRLSRRVLRGGPSRHGANLVASAKRQTHNELVCVLALRLSSWLYSYVPHRMLQLYS